MDPRVKRAKEMLEEIERDGSKPNPEGNHKNLISSLVGGLITILIGIYVLQMVREKL